MDKKTTREEVQRSGYFSIEQVSNGWAGAGFKQSYTEVQARRVNDKGRNETQIQVQISEVKGDKDRLYRTFGSLVLTPEQAKKLALAIYPELGQ